MVRALLVAAVVALFAGACSTAGFSSDSSTTTEPEVTSSIPPITQSTTVDPGDAAVARNQVGYAFPPAPVASMGLPSSALDNELNNLFNGLEIEVNLETVGRIVDTGDVRVAWLLSDLMRFVPPSETLDGLVREWERLTGVSIDADPISSRSQWQSVTDHLIAWDLEATPDYPMWKARLYRLVDERWGPFFDDPDAQIDWRLVSWGGVLIDDRPLGTTSPCVRGCIPALDDPVVTDASGGDWYPDDAIVFGVVVGDEARAYPKNMMEVHEMVNDTLGGRRLGIPYCTLCGSAQAYLTDSVPDGVAVPVLRTSGLLTRSNKVMYDLETMSVFDTFTGEALSGSLREAGIVLDQVSVVTSTWGAWKAEHPSTTIVARDGGIGRNYAADPLRGRDDNGPIFPIGDVDGTFDPQEKVLGVILDDGTPVAVPVSAARAHIEAGGTVTIGQVEVVAEGSGLRAVGPNGDDVGAHEAFWFAWSQFHPDTEVWSADG